MTAQDEAPGMNYDDKTQPMGLGVMQPGQRLSSNMVDGVDYQKAEPFVAYKNAYTEIKWDPLGKRCEMQGGTCVNEAI